MFAVSRWRPFIRRLIVYDPPIPSSIAGSLPAFSLGQVITGQEIVGSLGEFTGLATVEDYQVFARGSLGALSLGDVLNGNVASGSLPLFSSSGDAGAAVEIVTARGSLPTFSLQFVRASGSLPRFTSRAAAHLVESLTKQAWCTNLSLGETTRFTSFDFLAIVRIANTIYGVKSDGLYALGAATDNGSNIAANIITHPNDFGSSQFKRVQYLYLPGQPANFSISATVDGSALGPFSSTSGKQRATLPLGAKGRYWSFSISNVSGGAFKLDGMEPLINPMTRKV